MHIRKSLFAAALALGATVSGHNAVADPGDTLHWESIHGIVQANSVVGSGTGAFAGGGTPWTTQSGQAEVNLATGNLHFEVRGLVLAGSNSIGTRGGVAQVRGTLVCDTDGSASGLNSVFVDTDFVDLDELGNARFDGSVGPLPAACFEPDVAFLIRAGGQGRWIANGAVLR